MDTPFPQSAVQAFSKLREVQSDGGKQSGTKVKEWTKKALSATMPLVSVLEPLAELHPAAKIAVSTFKKLISMEQSRRESSEQIIVVYDSMTRVFATLNTLRASIQIQPGYSEPFDAEIEDIVHVMKEFGTFAGLFYTKFNNRLVRFFKAEEFVTELKQFTVSFERHREQLLFILGAQNSTEIQALRSDMQSVLALSQKIFARLKPDTKADKDAAKFVAAKGGMSAVLRDRGALEEVARRLSGGSSNVEAITAGTIEALRTPLDEMLEKHRKAFEIKLDRMQGVIVDGMKGIMKQLTSGPHELINDPDIKKIWEDNKWRLSVKCRLFVNYHPAIGEAIDEDATGYLSVQEVNRFLDKKPPGWSTPQWLVFWALGWHCMNSQCTDGVEYLLQEIRSYCKRLSRKQNETLKRVVEEFQETADMLEIVANWDEDGDADTDDLLADYDDLTSIRVMDLSSQLEGIMQGQVEEVMDDVNFCVEDPNDLEYVMSTLEWRIEQFFIPLLYVVLKHYFEYINEVTFSSDDDYTAIDNIAAALDSLDTTLRELLYAFHERMNSLCRSWRSQRMDDELQVQCYAGGLMYSWYMKVQESPSDINKFFYGDDEEEDATDDNDSNADSDSEEDDIPRNLFVGVRQMHKKVNGLKRELKEVKLMVQQLLLAVNPPGGSLQQGPAAVTRKTTGGVVDAPDVGPFKQKQGRGYSPDGPSSYAGGSHEGSDDGASDAFHGPLESDEGDDRLGSSDDNREGSPSGGAGSDDGDEDGYY
ncbi:hypothetical protein AURDEDRAFT_154414 [Auricularia subglabra TFB-10046 SS5]|uniref:EF-hand domain-containing protein n=1 Tax=Auricularia subglabra (strain TFB-10046 / SS5) TaxID=717982 RepID=J0WVL7_AURST|nr:hypothetical protein AURDEDRAFT_154414 [Auricularia subglabra TFB-10046 SS5]